MTQENHPLDEISTLTGLLRTVPLDNLNMDMLATVVNIMSNVMVRSAAENSPAIKQEIEAPVLIKDPEFEPGETCEALTLLHNPVSGSYEQWQRTTIIYKQQTGGNEFRYKTAATGRDVWLSAQALRKVQK
jgi:hypothetical protein